MVRIIRIEENYRDGMGALTIRTIDGGLDTAFPFHPKGDMENMFKGFQEKMLNLQNIHRCKIVYKETLPSKKYDEKHLQAMEAVRASGLCNMYDRKCVCEQLEENHDIKISKHEFLELLDAFRIYKEEQNG